MNDQCSYFNLKNQQAMLLDYFQPIFNDCSPLTTIAGDICSGKTSFICTLLTSLGGWHENLKIIYFNNKRDYRLILRKIANQLMANEPRSASQERLEIAKKDFAKLDLSFIDNDYRNMDLPDIKNSIKDNLSREKQNIILIDALTFIHIGAKCDFYQTLLSILDIAKQNNAMIFATYHIASPSKLMDEPDPVNYRDHLIYELSDNFMFIRNNTEHKRLYLNTFRSNIMNNRTLKMNFKSGLVEATSIEKNNYLIDK